MIKRIAILGDFNPAYSTHHSLNDSARESRRLFNEDLQFDWIATDMFNADFVFDKKMYSGLWVAPGSPYKDMQNVLEVIRYARANNIPTFGNCGGFQHMIIEYARNVCGIADADHAETSPGAAEPLITQLSCSLVQQEEELTIVDENSQLHTIIGRKTFTGRYHCSYGLNEKYAEVLEAKGLSFTAISGEGLKRAFELKTHPFFMGTLFQPALTSIANEPNPLIIAFIKHCIQT